MARWSEVGGPDQGVNLYVRDEASGTRKVFWSIALGKGEVATRANVVPSNGAMKTAVSRDEGGLGYISIGHVDASLTPVALDGVEATQANARDGTYPVVRKLYMNTRGEPTGLAKAFIDYVRRPACAGIIRSKGLHPAGRVGKNTSPRGEQGFTIQSSRMGASRRRKRGENTGLVQRTSREGPRSTGRRRAPGRRPRIMKAQAVGSAGRSRREPVRPGRPVLNPAGKTTAQDGPRHDVERDTEERWIA